MATRKKIIPKRIGSVKIPKNLRKFGDRILADPRAREVAGSALLALGTALLSRGTRKGSVLRDIFERRGEQAREAGAEAAAKAGGAASGVADAVSQVVGDVFDAVRRDFARKIRPVRPRHAHDEHDEDRSDGGDDRMH